MTPNQLYKTKPIKQNHRVHDAARLLNFMYEYDIPYNRIDKRIQVRYYADVDYDGRRGWQLASVWFNGVPVAISQRAGRELRDHSEVMITNKTKYLELLGLLYQIYLKTAKDDIISYNAHATKDVDKFYGDCLANHLKENSTQKTQ